MLLGVALPFCLALCLCVQCTSIRTAAQEAEELYKSALTGGVDNLSCIETPHGAEHLKNTVAARDEHEPITLCSTKDLMKSFVIKRS